MAKVELRRDSSIIKEILCNEVVRWHRPI